MSEGRGWLLAVGSTCWYTGGTQQCSLTEWTAVSGWPFCLGLEAVLWLRCAHSPHPPPCPPCPSPQVCLPGCKTDFPSLLGIWPPLGATTPAPHLEPATYSVAFLYGSKSCQGQMRFRHSDTSTLIPWPPPLHQAHVRRCYVPDLQQHKSMQWMLWLLICCSNIYIVRTFWTKKVLHWAGTRSKSNKHRTKVHSFPQDSNSHPLFREWLSHVPMNINFFIAGICFPFIHVSFSD